jgi:hypothetical protein
MTKLVQGPHKLGYFYTKFLLLLMYPKAQNDQWEKLEHISKRMIKNLETSTNITKSDALLGPLLNPLEGSTM